MRHQKNLNLYTREQIAELDQLTIKHDAQPGLQLMYRAALETWRAIQLRYPEASKIVVMAGAGNNGGDAYALACLARDDGLDVEVIRMGDLTRQSAESAHFRQWWLEADGRESAWQGKLPEADILVDGLLGTGLNKPLDADWIGLIESLNQHPATRVAIDIPSGLNANTGVAQPVAFKADLTVSYIGRKLGCYLADGPDFCGERLFADLGISRATRSRLAPSASLLDAHTIQLPKPRARNSHKNKFGHVLVVGGADEFAGAARLAGLAALHSGAGLVSLCVASGSVERIEADELMVADWSDFDDLAVKASVVIVGPGLGSSRKAQNVLAKVRNVDKPLVVDADALHAKFLDKLVSQTVVLTPHPGEAARLLDLTNQDIQQNRLYALEQLVSRWNAVCVLKGSGSLVGARSLGAASDASDLTDVAARPTLAVSVCDQGHPGMATAGMGDVLAGVIGGLMAQGLSTHDAAQSGVLVHAMAAEQFARTQAAEALTAGDVIEQLALVLQQVRTWQSPDNFAEPVA